MPGQGPQEFGVQVGLIAGRGPRHELAIAIDQLLQSVAVWLLPGNWPRASTAAQRAGSGSCLRLRWRRSGGERPCASPWRAMANGCGHRHVAVAVGQQFRQIRPLARPAGPSTAPGRRGGSESWPPAALRSLSRCSLPLPAPRSPLPAHRSPSADSSAVSGMRYQPPRSISPRVPRVLRCRPRPSRPWPAKAVSARESGPFPADRGRPASAERLEGNVAVKETAAQQRRRQHPAGGTQDESKSRSVGRHVSGKSFCQKIADVLLLLQEAVQRLSPCSSNS